MEIVRATVQYLNSGQVPVIALDQPLYALAKQMHIRTCNRVNST